MRDKGAEEVGDYEVRALPMRASTIITAEDIAEADQWVGGGLDLWPRVLMRKAQASRSVDALIWLLHWEERLTLYASAERRRQQLRSNGPRLSPAEEERELAQYRLRLASPTPLELELMRREL